MKLLKFSRGKILVKGGYRKFRYYYLHIMNNGEEIAVTCFTKPDLDFLETMVKKHLVIENEFRYSDGLELDNYFVIDPFTEIPKYYMIDFTIEEDQLRFLPNLIEELRENGFRRYQKVNGKDLYII